MTNYSVLQAAETKYAELIKNNSDIDGSVNNGNAGGTTGGNTGTTPTTTKAPATTETPAEQVVTVPAKVKITSAKNSVKKAIVIKWKKVSDARGYQVSYAINNKFTKS